MVPQNGWLILIMENPIKMDDLGVPLFLETPILVPPKSLVRLAMGLSRDFVETTPESDAA